MRCEAFRASGARPGASDLTGCGRGLRAAGDGQDLLTPTSQISASPRLAVLEQAGAEYGATPRPHNGPSPDAGHANRPQRAGRQGRCAARGASYNGGPFFHLPGPQWANGALSGEEHKSERDGTAAPGVAVLARRSPCGPVLLPVIAMPPAALPQRAGHDARRSDPGPGLRRLGQCAFASPAAALHLITQASPLLSISARSAGVQQAASLLPRACRPPLARRRSGSRCQSPPMTSRFAEPLSAQPRGPPSSERSIRSSPRGLQGRVSSHSDEGRRHETIPTRREPRGASPCRHPALAHVELESDKAPAAPASSLLLMCSCCAARRRGAAREDPPGVIKAKPMPKPAGRS